MYIVLYKTMGVISVHTLHQGSVLLMCYHVMVKATYDVYFMAKPGHFMSHVVVMLQVMAMLWVVVRLKTVVSFQVMVMLQVMVRLKAMLRLKGVVSFQVMVRL